MFKKQLEGLTNAMVMYINGNQSGMEDAGQRMLEVLQATTEAGPAPPSPFVPSMA